MDGVLEKTGFKREVSFVSANASHTHSNTYREGFTCFTEVTEKLKWITLSEHLHESLLRKSIAADLIPVCSNKKPQPVLSLWKAKCMHTLQTQKDWQIIKGHDGIKEY